MEQFRREKLGKTNQESLERFLYPVQKYSNPTCYEELLILIVWKDQNLESVKGLMLKN